MIIIVDIGSKCDCYFGLRWCNVMFLCINYGYRRYFNFIQYRFMAISRIFYYHIDNIVIDNDICLG